MNPKPLSTLATTRPSIAANARRFNPWALMSFDKATRLQPPPPILSKPRQGEIDFRINTQRLPSDAPSPSSDERSVRAVIEALMQSIRSRNPQALLALCSTDVACYDIHPPVAESGPDSVRAHWSHTWDAFVGDVGCDATQLQITLGADVAFSRSQLRLSGKSHDGRRTTHWVCATLGLRRIDGIWRFVHQHFSQPFERVVVSGSAPAGAAARQ